MPSTVQRAAEIDPLEEHRKLGGGDLLRLLGAIGPREGPRLEALCEEAETAAVPVDRLEAVARTVAEEDDDGIVEVVPEVLFDETSEPIDQPSTVVGADSRCFTHSSTPARSAAARSGVSHPVSSRGVPP